MDTVKELFKKVVAVLIINVLLMAHFMVAGYGIISYAINKIKTDNENIEILAYFEKADGKKDIEIESEIGKTLTLKLDVTVKNEQGNGGYFDGEFTIINSNFKLKDDSKLKVHVNSGETKTIEREIEYLEPETFYDGYQNREANVVLKGEYVNSKVKTNVEETTDVKVKWISQKNVKSELKGEILTNHQYEDSKKILQVIINNQLQNSSYPVKNNHVEIEIPEGVENVKVQKRVSTNLTDGITYENNLEERKTIIDMKDSTDPLVVTYEIPKETNIENTKINMTSKLTLYDNKELDENAEILINGEKEGSTTSLLAEKENEIFKGNLYSGGERKYTNGTRIYVDYIDALEKIEVNEKDSSYINEDNKETEANIFYKSSKISKKEFDNILGEDGNITINDQDGNTILNVDNETKVDEEENYIIEYGENVKAIKLITSKPVNTGILNIINDKIIKENKKREEIEKYVGIKENVEVNGKKVEKTINLKETDSNARVEFENNTLSTISDKEQKLVFAIKLDSSDESKELYKNPTITAILPKEITEIKVEQAKALYKNGLEIKSAKSYKNNDGNCIIELNFEGEQTSYDTNGGTEIYMYLKVKTDKLAPTKTSELKVKYTNEIKNVNKEITKQLNFESQNGLMVYTEANNTSTIENEQIETKLKMGKEKTEVQTKTILINNYEEELNNVVFTGEIKDNNFDISLNKIVNSKNAKISYSKDGNNWTQDSNKATKYKITIDKLSPAEKVEINSTLGVPGNLGFNALSTLEENINFNINQKEENIQKFVILKTEENITNDQTRNTENTEQVVTTESGLTAKIVAKTGNTRLSAGDEVYEGQTIKYEIEITNNSENDLENVNIKANQTNGKVWDYVEIAGENPVNVGTDENIPEHYYQITENTERSIKTIERLAKGETVKVEYEALPSGTGTTSGKIEITAGEGTLSEQINTIENTIKNSELQIMIRDNISRENEWLEDSIATYTVLIKNLTDHKLNDVVLKMSFSKEINMEGISENFDFIKPEDRDKFSIIGTEKNSNGETIATVKISELEAGYEFTLMTAARTSSINFQEKSKQSTLFVQGIVNSNTYSSNIFTREFYRVRKNIEANIKLEPENQAVKNGETFTIVTNIINKEDETLYYEFVDGIDLGLEVEKVTLVKDGESIDKTSGIKDGVIYLQEEVEKNKSVQIRVDAKIDTDYIADKTIKHKQTIVDLSSSKQMELTVNIETDKVIEDTNPSGENPGGNSGGNSGENQGENQGENPGGNSGDNSGTSESEFYNIEGTVWLDSNENGKRDTAEQRVKNMEIRILNTKTSSLEDTTIKTSEDGSYSVRLKKGNYILLFMYDNNKYKATTYQANGVSSSVNSDAVTRKVKMNNEISTVAATDELNLNKNINNIDLGLIESGKFDLKLDKYVKQIKVTNSAGTKTYTQDASETLAKVEIPAKNLNGSNVVITYTFKVTNVGNVAGYAKSIVDYLPSTLSFKEGLNKNWYKSGDKIYNTSLANTIINPGESKEITLTVTKTMTRSNTGLINNRAEIEQTKNTLNLVDKTEDNASADVLIGIRTGYVETILITILSTVIIISGIAYFTYKKIMVKI